MSVDKYIKIKANRNKDGSANFNKGQKTTTNYIMDDEKCIYNVQAAVEYMENEEKTYSPDTYKRFVSGWMCDPDTVTEDFKFAEQKYHAIKQEHLQNGHTPNVAYHFINSFQGHPDPALVHAMGIEFVKRFIGDDFQAIICTHTNTANYHNHILVNAYSLTDPPKKFKDEYNLYKKAREIMNEISLENGLPIIMTEEKQPYRSWSEVLDKDEYQSYKNQLKANIRAASVVTCDYTSFLQRMESLGYEIIQNKSSTSFKKDNASIRDTTLGSTFSKKALEQNWTSQQKKFEYTEMVEKLNKVRLENAIKYKKYAPILVPKWDEFGNRQSYLKRFLLLIKNFLLVISDDYYSPELNSQYPNNLNFQPATKKLQKINKAIEILDKYKIKSDTGIKNIMQEIGAELNQAKQDLQSTNNYLTNVEPLINDIEHLKELKELLLQAGFDLSSIALPVFDKETIRKNLTDLCPMTPKTKSRLYEKMHASTYRLAVSFNQLSQDEATEILNFLADTSDQKTKPNLLLSSEEYTSYLAKKDLAAVLELSNVDNSQPATQEQLDLLTELLKGKINQLEAIDKKTLDEKQYLLTLKTFDKQMNPLTLSLNVADRILSKLAPNPFPAPNNPAPCYDKLERATTEQFKLLCQIKRAYPDEFEHLNLSHFSSIDAGRLITYALSKQDDVFNEYLQTKGEKLNLSILSPELQALLKDYRQVKSNVLAYGIDTSEKEEMFLQNYNEIKASTVQKQVKSEIATSKYKEIKYLERTISDVNKPEFVYGATYSGTGEDLKYSKSNLGSPQLDRLLEIKQILGPILKQIDLSNLSDASITSSVFTPPSPQIRNILFELKDFFPDNFQNVNIAIINEFEALHIINDIFKKDSINKELEHLLQKEFEEQEIKDKNEFEKYKKKLLELPC